MTAIVRLVSLGQAGPSSDKNLADVKPCIWREVRTGQAFTSRIRALPSFGAWGVCCACWLRTSSRSKAMLVTVLSGAPVLRTNVSRSGVGSYEPAIRSKFQETQLEKHIHT